MKWLREIRNIYPDELQLLDEALTNFYSNPPKAYHEVAIAANENLNDQDHIFHRRIVSHAYPGAKVLDVQRPPVQRSFLFQLDVEFQATHPREIVLARVLKHAVE